LELLRKGKVTTYSLRYWMEKFSYAANSFKEMKEIFTVGITDFG
jgi:hypothetical protein